MACLCPVQSGASAGKTRGPEVTQRAEGFGHLKALTSLVVDTRCWLGLSYNIYAWFLPQLCEYVFFLTLLFVDIESCL